MINRVNCYPTNLDRGNNTATIPFRLVDSGANFITAGVSVGDIVVNTTNFTSAFITNVSTIMLQITNNLFTTIGNNYAIYKASNASEAEAVSMGKIMLLNNSLLTAPSNIYPAYTMSNNGILTVYPSTISGYGAVQTVYFRYPKDPKWTFITLTNGEPVFDQSQLDYQDFELPFEDEYKLAIKILQYCGITIREGEVVQYALGQEMQRDANT
jgi:hypothetical protein